MKRVLIIGADFSPSSLPPALRIRFFANHLAEFGWKPTVLAVDPRFYETEVDPDNENLVAPEVEVVRTRALRPDWTRKFGLGDLGLRSLWHQWRKASEICRDRRPDLLFVPVPPYFSMILGRLLHFRHKVPYVVDYIDPWVIEDHWRRPRHLRPPKWAFAYWASRTLEPFALRRVSRIVGVSEGTCRSVVERYRWLNPNMTHSIPYGGEPADFDYLRKSPRRNLLFEPNDGRFHLTYAGAFIPAMHETAGAIFRAIRMGLDREPKLFERLRVHFLGTSYGAREGRTPLHAERLANEAGLPEGTVRETARRAAYLDALQALLDSQGLLAVGSDAPHYTASKLFPYILAGKPILAVFHEASSVVEILRQTGAGMAVCYGDSRRPADADDEIRAELAAMLAGRRQTDSVAAEAFEDYSTRSMARRLAGVFDRAAADRPEP